MEEELIGVKNTALSLILDCDNLKELEELRLQFLGRSGKLTLLLKELPKLPLEKRGEIGKLANEVKKTIEETLENQKSKIKNQNFDAEKETIDKTIPGIKPEIGHLHPMTQVLSEVVDIFKSLGFQAADGPEIETDYYNFEALNIPKDHPARDTQQTLYIDTRNSRIAAGETLLRTQTSNMQGRIMEKIKPPFRVIVPGKVFRYEQVDASHGFEFQQFEGFAVDENIKMTDLFGVIEYFFKKFFGEKTKVRFVCHNFPFVEPGAEAYISCNACKGKGCAFCKNSGWVEILGAGMIHPNVLRNVNIDPNKYHGFAFGVGLSRLATLRYQMDDLRLLTNPDMRILEQF
ncbi:MAG: phenylalanine--tRNA ligase subunit alpha [Patescibacteria group bacterium]|mgnify:CR=1 FL=1